MANTMTKNGDVAATPEAQLMKGSVSYVPRFDIWEDENELVLYGDLPGVAPEDLDIHFENHELRIYGRVAPRYANVEALYSEYGIGDFHRTFTVGESIDTEQIAAELKNGVLTVRLPKSEAVKPRRIEVKG
ncbi:MAG: Hsp20/alpha crystallin family protein [Pirellulaceae bacterium]|jgi:HSP20 family molecular chaperone IbpA|nr:Hsp20/alpha crystallin family protein [Pirellulaceae bacterium]